MLEAPDHPMRRTDLFPYPDRVEGGRLSPVTGYTLAQHLDRLAIVREILLSFFRSMSLEDFHRLRTRERYDVSRRGCSTIRFSTRRSTDPTSSGSATPGDERVHEGELTPSLARSPSARVGGPVAAMRESHRQHSRGDAA